MTGSTHTGLFLAFSFSHEDIANLAIQSRANLAQRLERKLFDLPMFDRIKVPGRQPGLLAQPVDRPAAHLQDCLEIYSYHQIILQGRALDYENQPAYARHIVTFAMSVIAPNNPTKKRRSLCTSNGRELRL